jgi:type III restriction enzyme
MLIVPSSFLLTVTGFLGGHEKAHLPADNAVKYDLAGKTGEETGLTHQTAAAILKSITQEKCALFAENPEEFIIKTARIINEQKATAIVQYIEHTLLQDTRPFLPNPRSKAASTKTPSPWPSTSTII